LEYYATKWWSINFAYYVIHRTPASYDTTIELPWTSIDTAYAALRSAFAALEAKYGTLHLKEYAPNDIDSTDGASKSYKLRFDNYVCVDSVLKDMDSMLSPIGVLGHGFQSYPVWLAGVSDIILKYEGLTLNPNPARDILIIHRKDGENIHQISLFDPLGKSAFEMQYRGSNEVMIDTHQIASGSYILVCDNTFTADIIIVR
jgi:hypothetical protein